MKAPTIVSLSVILAGALGIGFAAGNRPAAESETLAVKGGESKVAKFMRGKLAASESVLEGLVTEDFDKIEKGGEKMVLMSKAADWQVIQGPTYAQYSAEFRRAADRMVKMAKKKQLDSAALNYMNVTMTCINCHKYVKNAKVARGEPLSPGFQLVLQRDVRRLKSLDEDRATQEK